MEPDSAKELEAEIELLKRIKARIRRGMMTLRDMIGPQL